MDAAYVTCLLKFYLPLKLNKLKLIGICNEIATAVVEYNEIEYNGH